MKIVERLISTAKQRANPDKLATSLLISGSASVFVPWAQIFFTTTFHELARFDN